MASMPTRASGLWASATDDEQEMGFFEDDDDIENVETQRLVPGPTVTVDDGRTALDKTIDRIGMGSYQWTLLSLCGFGWMADNMWMQAIAIILPRVQQHYAVSDGYIGVLSSSMFAGMMVGAVGWGTCSDLMGRSAAFNATLFFTAVFGMLASFSTSFNMLCVMLFLLGSAVGGSMPTDGTLLLEHMPNGKQYLVTALSVFFSFGAVLSAVVALLVVPKYSCPQAPAPCDVISQNRGWQYLLITLGLITLTMFIARVLFFRLHESPRYLVHAGRHQEALETLQLIARYNGSDLDLGLDDVDDWRAPASEGAAPRDIVFDADEADRTTTERQTSEHYLRSQPEVKDYQSTAESPPRSASPLPVNISPVEASPLSEFGQELTVHSRMPYAGLTPISDTNPRISTSSQPPIDRPSSSFLSPNNIPRPQFQHPRSQSRRMSTLSTRSTLSGKRMGRSLPRWLRKPMWAWWDRVVMVTSPEWLRTTLLMWSIWCLLSLGYTMFNIFLPTLLETSAGEGGGKAREPKTLEATLWDVVIYTIGGCPGAILGAWLIESPLGRRWSLAGSTFATAGFCVVFILMNSSWAVRASSIGISLSGTAMWAVLYGWTPEIFGTKVRGTACGIASALSRIGGMIAPIVGGLLLEIDRSIPVYTSVAVFIIAAICVLLLKEGAGDSKRKSDAERVTIH